MKGIFSENHPIPENEQSQTAPVCLREAWNAVPHTTRHEISAVIRCYLDWDLGGTRSRAMLAFAPGE